jgi:hypothetical protein
MLLLLPNPQTIFCTANNRLCIGKGKQLPTPSFSPFGRPVTKRTALLPHCYVSVASIITAPLTFLHQHSYQPWFIFGSSRGKISAWRPASLFIRSLTEHLKLCRGHSQHPQSIIHYSSAGGTLSALPTASLNKSQKTSQYTNRLHVCRFT